MPGFGSEPGLFFTLKGPDTFFVGSPLLSPYRITPIRLYSSERDGKQTDIYEYFIQAEKIEQVTATESSEYTPKSSPDNLIITFVRDGGVNPDQTV